MSLDSAEMEKNGQKPHMCKVCKERFVTQHFLMFHMSKTHPNSLAFECNICEKAFRLAIHLDIHKSTCNADKPTENPSTSTTADSEDIESSCTEINSDSEIEKRKDNKGKKMNPEKRLKNKDVKTTKGKNTKKQKNKVVDEIFKKPKSQYIALRETKELKPLPPGETITYTTEIVDGKTCQRCSFCKRLMCKSERKKHTRRHLRIKPYTCKYCGAGFTTEDGINRHVRTHNNQKPFACKFCTERFTCPQTLKFHERAHVGIKLYQCEHCREKFLRYCTLRNHIISKHII